MNLKAFFVIFGLVFSFLIFPSSISSTESTASAQIGSSRITPNSPLYFLKTIREGIEMKLALTDNVKNFRQLEFATRRLRETKSLIGTDEDLVLTTLERYASHLHILNSSFQQKGQKFDVEINNSLSVHLQVLYDLYKNAKTAKSKMAIRSAMNRIILVASLPTSVKKATCDLFEQEASSSALSKTEQFVLKERAQACFKSLL